MDTKENQWGQPVPMDSDGKYAPANGGDGNEHSEDSQSGSTSPILDVDWGFALTENAIAENQFAEIAKNNEQQIAEAEHSMGDKAKSIYEVWGDLYDLDSKLLSNATPEQLEELLDAIESKQDIEATQKFNEFKKAEIAKKKEELENWAHANLAYIWKSKTYPDIQDYPEMMDKIKSKIDWYEEQLASDNPQYSTSTYQLKIDALKQWEEKYKDYTALEQDLDDLEGESPKAGLLEGKNAIIAKFQDKTSMYSQARKNNAVWCKTIAQAKKEFGPLAKKQRQQMTHSEENSLISYTGSGAATINRGLNALKYNSMWGPKEIAAPKAYEQCLWMTDALDKCISDKDCWIQRGIDDLHLGGLDFDDIIKGKVPLDSLVGREFINNSFMSCGTHKGGGFKGPIILNIYCPKGTKMHYVNEVSNYEDTPENETIIQRGYHFVIKKVEKTEYGQYYFDLDLLVGSDSDRLSNEQVKKMYYKYLL